MDALGVARERISANVAPLLAVEALMVELRRSRMTGQPPRQDILDRFCTPPTK